jgi:hypothetical protein
LPSLVAVTVVTTSGPVPFFSLRIPLFLNN